VWVVVWYTAVFYPDTSTAQPSYCNLITLSLNIHYTLIFIENVVKFVDFPSQLSVTVTHSVTVKILPGFVNNNLLATTQYHSIQLSIKIVLEVITSCWELKF
jgi:hypothetical protein